MVRYVGQSDSSVNTRAIAITLHEFGWTQRPIAEEVNLSVSVIFFLSIFYSDQQLK